MTKLSDLATPEMRERIRNAWPFTIDAEPLMEGERPQQVVRMPAFDVGQRVIVNPTPGSSDPALKKGGPGTVCHVKDIPMPGRPRTETMVYVLVDGAQETRPEPFHTCELKPEPTV